jgi:hypothetical protein
MAYLFHLSIYSIDRIQPLPGHGTVIRQSERPRLDFTFAGEVRDDKQRESMIGPGVNALSYLDENYTSHSLSVTEH